MRRPRFTTLILGLLAVLATVLVLAPAAGPVPVPARGVLAIVVHHLAPGVIEPGVIEPGLIGPGLAEPVPSRALDSIVWQLRIPRVLLAALVGGGLALAGAALQAVTRNPLADPFLFGTSAGAAAGVVAVVMHIGLFAGPLTALLAAFAGASMATLLVVLLSASAGPASSERLILSGVAVSFVMMAATNFMIFASDPRAASQVLFWMLGGLGRARWDQLALPAAVVALSALYLVARAGRLDALLAGDETAVTLGVRAERERVASFVVVALLTGALVSVSGVVGFVGLMIPHAVRPFTGAAGRRLMPVALIVGAIFLIAVDAFARTVLAPEDLPIGIMTAAIGGAFFMAISRLRAPRA